MSYPKNIGPALIKNFTSVLHIAIKGHVQIKLNVNREGKYGVPTLGNYFKMGFDLYNIGSFV